jgi:hypothetical protein
MMLAPFVTAQIEPDSAQVDLYFPQLADGGTRARQWQTSFYFVNPSTTSSASVVVDILGNDGQPLQLDLGSGPSSSFTFTIPPQGSRIFKSKIASPQIITGWAVGAATIPLQASVVFTSFQNGVSQFQVSAASTLPTGEYWSAANGSLGIAVANVYNNGPVTLNISAIDAGGNTFRTTPVTIGALAHNSFNLNHLFPSLPSSFTGSITISPVVPTNNFVAWTLNSDSGALSSLPSGTSRWPISHFDRIWLVYRKVLDAARQLTTLLRTDLTSPVPTLNISPDPVINAFASPTGTNGTVQINLATSELISDSESELAFVVAHELGHIVQFRTHVYNFNTNPEFDADEYGMLLSLIAGYDPYAAAGALAKLNMATGQAGLLAQLFDNFSGDLHGSFDNRIAAVFNTISVMCTAPQAASFCAAYKSIVHPHFPGSTPLGTKVSSK